MLRRPAVAIYLFINCVYLAAFYCTMFRTTIVVAGVDFFAELRGALTWQASCVGVGSVACVCVCE